LALKNIDRRLATILLIVLVQMLGAAMILPILPLYAQREYGLTPQVITLLGTSFFAAQFIAGPYLGRLSDKYGRIPVLIISQIGTAISFLMLALAPGAGFLFLARVIDGITGGNIIVAQAYITDITPREKRTEALGYIFAVFGLGFILGPALGGVLSAAFGPRVPYLFAAGAAVVVVLLTWITLEESLSPEQREANRQASGNSISPRKVLHNKPLILILIIAFIGQSGLGLLQSTFALYGEAVLFKGYSPQTTTLGIGLLLATFGLSQFLTQAFFLRPLLVRFGEYRLVIFGNLGRMIGSFGYALVATPWLGAASSVIFAVGIGIMMPSLQSLATNTVGDEYRGGVLGLYQSTLSLSIIISSAISGVLFAINATLPYWIGGFMAALALIPALILLTQFGKLKSMPGTASSTAD
jgi:DHA1 family tetracycline resistance protein-like MFS transporter